MKDEKTINDPLASCYNDLGEVYCREIEGGVRYFTVNEFRRISSQFRPINISTVDPRTCPDRELIPGEAISWSTRFVRQEAYRD
jgi:hypothetical protein